MADIKAGLTNQDWGGYKNLLRAEVRNQSQRPRGRGKSKGMQKT